MRADGETLIGQPHLDDERRWTLSDIRAHDLKLQSPNIRVARELGLPSGDWSDVPRADGAVPLELAPRDPVTVGALRVRFEPIGEEIDCAPEETVLDAAFRQGYNLAYGCREGQCSACKCYLLEGEVDLKRYSNFALSDSERGERLLADVPGDARVRTWSIELLHYDPDNYRLEHAIRDGVGDGRGGRAADRTTSSRLD